MDEIQDDGRPWPDMNPHWMAPLGRFLLALGGGAFVFFLVAFALPTTSETLIALREWWDTIHWCLSS